MQHRLIHQSSHRSYDSYLNRIKIIFISRAGPAEGLRWSPLQTKVMIWFAPSHDFVLIIKVPPSTTPNNNFDYSLLSPPLLIHPLNRTSLITESTLLDRSSCFRIWCVPDAHLERRMSLRQYSTFEIRSQHLGQTTLYCFSLHEHHNIPTILSS